MLIEQTCMLHTPGHTMESSCYLLKDEKGHDRSLFTGDTLFTGNVGRPDLAQKIDAALTAEKLAAHLYDSIHNKIMPLRNDILIYPGHGAGSACGKHLSDQRCDSLGSQKRHNYALKNDLSKEDFITTITSGLTPPPAYFIPNSINIGIDGNFAPWAGTLIPDLSQPILLITDEGRQEEVITRLARVGLDRCIGYLQGGLEAWKVSGRPTDKITSITAKEFAVIMSITPIDILDVRKASEFAGGHVLNAENIPLDYVNDNMHRLDRDKTYYVYCAGGYRCMIFCSILKARWFRHFIDKHHQLLHTPR